MAQEQLRMTIDELFRARDLAKQKRSRRSQDFLSQRDSRLLKNSTPYFAKPWKRTSKGGRRKKTHGSMKTSCFADSISPSLCASSKYRSSPPSISSPIRNAMFSVK